MLKRLINRVRKYCAKESTVLLESQIDLYYYTIGQNDEAGTAFYPRKSFKFYPVCCQCGRRAKHENFSIIVAPVKEDAVTFFCSQSCLYEYNLETSNRGDI